MANWIPMFALPHVRAEQAIEADGIALVSTGDERLLQITKNHPSFASFLKRFKTEFGVGVVPSIIIWRNDLPDSSRTIAAIFGFRDAIALAVIPYSWGQTHRFKRPTGIRYSDWFSIYPWMLDKDFNHLFAQTMAVLALHEVQQLRAQTLPCVSAESLPASALDVPLLTKLLAAWTQCYCLKNPSHEDVVLFRSLNMAHAAAAMPTTVGNSTYDMGRSVALWVSAFEILTPDRRKGYRKVYELLLKPKWNNSINLDAKYPTYGVRELMPLPCWLYGEFLHARNDFLHGNPVTSERLTAPSGRSFYYYAAPLYRMALTGYLGLTWNNPVPPIAPSEVFGANLSDHHDFIWYQRTIEDGLARIVEPKDVDND
jgi:hypothetical protein